MPSATNKVAESDPSKTIASVVLFNCANNEEPATLNASAD